MILKAARKWLAGRGGGKPRRIAKNEHGIRPDDIGKNALNAVRRLARAGYDAYIVGGAVRDLLLGLQPKDFDIATSATPAQVRRLFRNSRLIGRRFRLIHLYYGAEIIEVATFRARAEESEREESGRIVRDNRFGEAAEDAKRRDFTANALFYDPTANEVLDYVGGFDDIRRRRLRIIGKSEERIREDPVRMLRALRLSAKTRLALAPSTTRLFPQHADALLDISSARLLDEFVKIVHSGCCAVTFQGWRKHKLAARIFPQIDGANLFSERTFAEADKRMGRGKAVSVSFVSAAIYWPVIRESWLADLADGKRPVGAMERALGGVNLLDNRVLSRRVAARMMDLYFLLARMKMQPSKKKRCDAICDNTLFKRAVAFAELEDELRDMAEWWQRYDDSGAKERLRMLPKSAPKKRRAKKN